jgi:formyl-CoA transferase
VLADIFSTKSSTEWFEQLAKAGVLCAPVNSGLDMPQDAHVVAQDRLGEFYQPMVTGYVTQLKTLFKLSETPPVISRPAPLPGQHTEEVLSELGYSAKEIEELKKLRVIP